MEDNARARPLCVRQAGFLGIGKRPLAAPPPSHERFLALFAAQHDRGREERAIEHGAVIIGEIDQPGFDDEPAKLNELTRAFAALHLPFPRVMPRSFRQYPVAHFRHAAARSAPGLAGCAPPPPPPCEKRQPPPCPLTTRSP